MNVETIRDLFEVELRKAYSIETALLDELATLADDVVADSLDDLRQREVHESLRDVIVTHRDETETHVQRLEDAFAALDRQPEGRSIPALDGLVAEKELFDNVVLNDELRPVFYLGTVRQIEHHELLTYDRLLRIAEHLDVPDAVTDALAANRDDEEATLEDLETLAESDDAESLLEALAETTGPG